MVTDQKIAEKAREYANHPDRYREHFMSKEDALIQGFIAGYSQLSAEVEKHREALRQIEQFTYNGIHAHAIFDMQEIATKALKK